MLVRHGRGFGLSDPEETASAVGHRPLGSTEGLLVGLGHAATSPDSPLDFRQAQTAAERSGVASSHRLESNVANERKGCPRSV